MFKTLFVSFLLVISFVASGLAQSMNRDSLNVKYPVSARNSWRFVPQVLKDQKDLVPPAVRYIRDQYWDSLIGSSTPLTEPQTQSMMAAGHSSPTSSELVAPPGTAWIVAEFIGFDSFLSSSKKSVYTEKHYRIAKVIRDFTGLRLAPQAIIDIGSPGGTVLTQGNQKISYFVRPSDESDIPGRRYILRVKYFPAQLFFQLDDALWEINERKAVPIAEVDVARSRRGSSRIEGLNEDEAVRYLDDSLPKTEGDGK